MNKIIYIDVSCLLSCAFISGIQRVTKEGIKYLFQNSSKYGFSIILLAYDPETRNYRVVIPLPFFKDSSRIPLGMNLLTDQHIGFEELTEESVFFEIDSVWANIPPRYELFPILKKKKIKIAVQIYDIIPIMYPSFFTLETVEAFLPYFDVEMTYADKVFVNSGYVENCIREVLTKAKRKAPDIKKARLGSNFMIVSPDNPQIDSSIKEIAGVRPYLLMVSTLEIRKNHKIVLDAFDQYLRDKNISIIFAGRKGWNVDDLITRIHNHEEYNRKLFHIEGLNNETISYLYQNALFTIFPTITEGFGLPAVESLISQTPVLLSDIPVLREVAEDYAQYFEPNDAKRIAELVTDGLENPVEYRKRKDKLKDYRPYTWKQFGDTISEELNQLFY